MTNEEIDHRFTYHPPEGKAQVQKYTELRAGARGFAKLVNKHCPDGREKSLAITKIEEAVMWANASVAREEKSDG